MLYFINKTVNAEKSWTFPKKKVGLQPKQKLDINPKICKTLFKIIFYNKIKFWTLPRRSSIFNRILRGRLLHPQKTRLKSDSEISYFFFDLFFFLKTKPIINRIIRKRNSLFRIGFQALFVGDWLGMGSK